MTFSQELGENIDNLENAFEQEESGISHDPTDDVVPGLLYSDDDDDEDDDFEVTVLLY